MRAASKRESLDLCHFELSEQFEPELFDNLDPWSGKLRGSLEVLAAGVGLTGLDFSRN